MYSALAIAFASVAAALPAPQAGTTTPLRFTGMSLRSGSPIQFGSINAHDLSFVIGKNTTTSTPEGVEGINPANYNNNQTIFSFLDSASTLGLSTTVPGGQQVYVTKGDKATGQRAGQLKFTQAHSVSTAGPALYDGFNIVYNGKLEFEKQDWVACPLDDCDSAYSVWSAARIESSHAKDCLGFTFDIEQVSETTKSAWEYTK